MRAQRKALSAANAAHQHARRKTVLQWLHNSLNVVVQGLARMRDTVPRQQAAGFGPVRRTINLRKRRASGMPRHSRTRSPKGTGAEMSQQQGTAPGKHLSGATHEGSFVHKG